MKNATRIICAAVAVVILLGCLYGCGPATEGPVKSGLSEEGRIALRTKNFAIGKLDQKFLDSLTDAQLAEISHLMYYESELQRGIKLGQKWVYTNTNKYSPQATTFDHMVESGMYGVNCAMPAGWAVIDLGILNEGQRFYGDLQGNFANYDKVHEQLETACDITEHNFPTFGELYEKGLVKPGDMFLAKGHTFIYLGDNKFFAAGHDGKWHSDYSAPTEDGQHAVFESWIMDLQSCANYSHTVSWQISLKKDYTPKTFRDKDGKIVEIQ